MFRALMLAAFPLLAVAQTAISGVGRPATPAEVEARNITVFPDGSGLPAGRGTARGGKSVYQDKCANCHNDLGQGREAQYPALVGGRGSLTTSKPVKTVGSFWPYPTTLWDYVHRGMPYDQPGSLSVDNAYAVTAYVLFLNGIVGENQELTEKTLPKVVMPNRNGFVPDSRPAAKQK